jgi:hypothetical protein
MKNNILTPILTAAVLSTGTAVSANDNVIHLAPLGGNKTTTETTPAQREYETIPLNNGPIRMQLEGMCTNSKNGDSSYITHQFPQMNSPVFIAVSCDEIKALGAETTTGYVAFEKEKLPAFLKLDR